MFNPVAARAVIRCTDILTAQKDHIPIKTWTVIEFGNQRYGAQGVEPRGWPKIETTQQFYEAMGFKYSCLDVNDNMGAIICDLNQPVRPQLSIGYHTLVTNNGTGEHIFNQRNVFGNAHELCNLGGIMLHVLPFAPWENHGFFNYNPILFRDLYKANRYRLLFMWMTTRNDSAPSDLPVGDGSWLFQEKRPKQLQRWVKNAQDEVEGGPKEIYMVAALQRMSPEGFKVPLQGKYKADVRDPTLESIYT